MSSDESSKVKKNLAIRYPYTFWEKISRDLAIYSYWRENKRIFKALPLMDSLIDAVTIDPATGKRVYDLKEYDQSRLILIPRELVQSFRTLWHGPRKDRVPALKWLAPGPNLDPKSDIVYIKQPIKLREAIGDRPTEYSALALGFSYKVQTMSPAGFPVTETLPMIKWDDPDIDLYYTNSIPYSVWTEFYEGGMEILGPICTRIERIIAQRLEEKGHAYGEAELPAESQEDAGGDDDGDAIL